MSLSLLARTAAAALFLAAGSAYAQQGTLYLRNGRQMDRFVSAVAEGNVICKIADRADASEEMLPFKQLAMIFFKDGTLHIFDPSLPGGTRSVNFADGKTDRLLTVDEEVINGAIVSETAESVRITPSGKTEAVVVRLNRVLLILRRDGSYLLLGEPAEVAGMLKNAQIGTETAAARMQPEPAPATAPVPDPAPAKPAEAELNIDFEAFKGKAVDKANQLYQYMVIIANKTTAWEDANRSIDQAVTLFLNEEAQVEVSVAGSELKQRFPIRKYLERLKLLKYDQVEITWSDVTYVSNFTKGPDGNYYGVVSFLQRFTGIREGKPVYSDVTRKNITVVLKSYEKIEGGQVTELWDVFLSDIGVVNTRKG
ncbi:MAG: hypothetical protein NW241_13735 [Bacteroidia bacterium]|nr:hypothetical protein [Bacteroidia bacterium]